MFFYRGMQDMYTYHGKGESYCVFYHEGEFYLHDRKWNAKGLPKSEEFKYFDTSDEVLEAMQDIAPWRDWKLYDLDEVV